MVHEKVIYDVADYRVPLWMFFNFAASLGNWGKSTKSFTFFTGMHALVYTLLTVSFSRSSVIGTARRGEIAVAV